MIGFGIGGNCTKAADNIAEICLKWLGYFATVAAELFPKVADLK